MKTLIISMLFLFTIPATTALADGEGYRLSTVDKVEVVGAQKIRITFTLPCKDLTSSTFVGARNDSGSREVQVGVVYTCTPGENETFTSEVTKDSSEFSVLKAGLLEGASFVPMIVAH